MVRQPLPVQESGAMIEWDAWLWSGAAMLAFAVVFWVLSLVKDDVSIVDSLWSLMFLLVVVVYWLAADETGPRAGWLFGLVGVWALRLSAYITWRNHGQGEDRRYQEIRKNNEPGFRYKSFYIVFGLQGVLAWIISLPLVAAIGSSQPLGWVDAMGFCLWGVGFLFEAVGDFQLARFKADPKNKGRVMNKGLWQFTRHPNYFGNFTLWWGFYLFALSGGAPWTIVSPLLMSFLLLKVSGVTLLEKDIGERRPAYAKYARTTNAFFPGPRRA
jgi:steroid 5-alpha reductase family enzyme